MIGVEKQVNSWPKGIRMDIVDIDDIVISRVVILCVVFMVIKDPEAPFLPPCDCISEGKKKNRSSSAGWKLKIAM